MDVNYSQPQWQCLRCSFKNYPLLSTCQMCQGQKKQPIKSDLKQKPNEKEKEKGKYFACPQCYYQYDTLQQCPKCAQALLFISKQKQSILSKNKINMIICKKCKNQNDQTNNKCVFCDFSLKVIEKNSQKQFNSKINNCSFCHQKFNKQELKDHNKTCQQRDKFFNSNQSFDRMTPLQVKTIKYMHQKLEPKHYKLDIEIKEKIKKLNFTNLDLDNLYHYIAHYAPIIIHMSATRNMQHYIKDTHYRNIFQVSKTNCMGRVQWEDRMFDQFHHHASFYQRVKYGTINFTNDPKGVKACVGYGQSYFLLKQHVRDRCTFTDMDSASSTATIATFRFCNPVLNKMTESELKSAIQASKALQLSSNVIRCYKQIQIHGPVQFGKDIERVYIHRQEWQNVAVKKQIEEFCEKNKLQYEIFGQLFKKQYHQSVLMHISQVPMKIEKKIKQIKKVKKGK